MKKSILFLFFLSIIFTNSSIAAVIKVGKSGADFSTITSVFNSLDLEPGDIIEIIDSATYNENIVWGSNDGGSATAGRVLLRAAIDKNPVIAGTIDTNRVNYIQIGQNGNGTISITPTTHSWVDAISINQSDYCVVENNIVQNVYDGRGIALYGGSDYNVIQNCTIHDIGTSYFSSGSQGEGIEIHYYSSIGGGGQYNIIRNNTLYNCAHGNIGIYGNNADGCNYNQILNNYIYGGMGNYISVLGARYCLVDNNRLYDVGTIQTTLAKSAIQLTSSKNCSIRRNIIYNGHHYYAFEMFQYGSPYQTDNNYIYNNTIHTWATSSSAAGGGSAVGLGGSNSVNTSCEGNKFYNNIFWDINHTGQSGWRNNTYKLIFTADYEGMASNNDWGDSIAQLNNSRLGNHDIKNNVLRSHGGAGYCCILAYCNSGGSFYGEWSISQMHTEFSNSCAKNIESNPNFSQDPSGNTGPNDIWWHLQSNSSCIDAGIVVNDPNAAIGGWPQLTFNESAPDIGAYESGIDAPPAPPVGLRIVE